MRRNLRWLTLIATLRHQRRLCHLIVDAIEPFTAVEDELRLESLLDVPLPVDGRRCILTFTKRYSCVLVPVRQSLM